MSEVLTQHGKILRVLKQNPKGTPNYKFTDMHILDYTARISELRKDGHNIYCERVKRDGKATGTFLYFLNDEVQEEPKKKWWQ